jgi:hypothetical protein
MQDCRAEWGANCLAHLGRMVEDRLYSGQSIASRLGLSFHVRLLPCSSDKLVLV